ncbi:MAG: pantetheine-phosphate adenylyltransferase [Bacteroidota bacterium]
MKKTAVFPGSFDPITKGHESIVKRAIPLFDEIVIAIGINSTKEHYFPLEKRIDWLNKVFVNEVTVRIEKYEGLTVDFCNEINAQYILRGLRTSADFEFERTIALMNKAMVLEIETVFILSIPELSAINSTIVRDILSCGGDASQFVPEGVDLI